MVITCPKCETNFKVDDEKIKPGGTRFKCTKCGETMLVNLHAEEQGEIEGVPPQSTQGMPSALRRFMSAVTRQERTHFLRSFTERLPGVFAYPFHGSGIWMLVAGTLFFWLMLGVNRFFLGFLRTLVAVAAMGYLMAFMMKIISHSADGEAEVPDWPGISDPWNEIFVPVGKMLGVLLFSFAPALIYVYFAGSSDIIFMLLCGIALLYIPMALIIASVSDSLTDLDPRVVIRSISKIRADYLVACAVLFALVVIRYVGTLVTSHIPMAGSLIDTFLMLYFITVEMRIIGLLYYTNRKLFGWHEA